MFVEILRGKHLDPRDQVALPGGAQTRSPFAFELEKLTILRTGGPLQGNAVLDPVLSCGNGRK